MSGLVARRWFATKEARSWDDDAPIAVLYSGTERIHGKLRNVWRLACWYRFDKNNAAENAMPTPVDVTTRSLAHVDRLARDFIGHGVTPTRTGGRGVHSPWRHGLLEDVEHIARTYGACATRSGGRPLLVAPVEIAERFERAEARAARVVWR